MKGANHNVCVKQHEACDCGPACLASIAAYHGLYWPLERIRQASATQKEGSSIKGLMDAAKSMGFTAEACMAKVPREETALTAGRDPYRKVWPLLPYPSILHLQLQDRTLHFIVCYACEGCRLRIMDPKNGSLVWHQTATIGRQWTGAFLSLKPDPEHFAPGDFRHKTGPRLTSLVLDNKWALSGAFACALVFTGGGLAAAAFLRYLFDVVLVSRGSGLHSAALCLLVITLAAAGSKYLTGRLLLSVSLKLSRSIIRNFYHHIWQLPKAFFEQRQTGDIMARLSDGMQISLFLTGSLNALAVCMLTLLLGLWFLFAQQTTLAAICLCWLPFYMILYAYLNKRQRRLSRESATAGAYLRAMMVDHLRAAASIKYFTAESSVEQAIEEPTTTLLHTARRKGLVELGGKLVNEGLTQTLSLAILWIGTDFVLRDRMSAGALMSFYALSAWFSGPIGELTGFNRQWREARTAAERLYEIMDLEPEQKPGCTDVFLHSSSQRHIVSVVPALCLEHLGFHYPGRPVLFQDLNWEIPAGGIVALTGPSGCGKSSLAGLIMRTLIPSSGRITWDGEDINHTDIKAWRHLVSLVPQHIELIRGSLLDNICLGSEGEDKERIGKICRDTGISDFLDKLPLGLFSPVGEQGARLSGGQKQRIALARALYRRPKLLLLDEATSSLDHEAEKAVTRCIQNFRKEGGTVVIVAHRTTSLEAADTVWKLENGYIVKI